MGEEAEGGEARLGVGRGWGAAGHFGRVWSGGGCLARRRGDVEDVEEGYGGLGGLLKVAHWGG